MFFNKESLAAHYGYKDDFTHWKRLWNYMGIFEIMLMAISVAFSYMAFKTLFFSKLFPEYGWIPSLVLPLIVSIIILGLTWRVFASVKEKGTFPPMQTLILVMFLALNCVSDFMGSPEYAKKFQQKPPQTNPEKSIIQAKIDRLDSLSDNIYADYCYNGVCKETIAQVRAHPTKWGHNSEGDADQLQEYQNEKLVYVSELKQSNEIFQKYRDNYFTLLKRDEGIMKGTSIGITIIFLLVSYWRTQFAVEVANSHNPDEEEKNKNKPNTKEPSKKEEFSEEQMKKAKDWLLGQIAENPELLEEMRAQQEQEKKS